MRAVFLLGRHQALSAAEVFCHAERLGIQATWDLSRLPGALIGEGEFPPLAGVVRMLGGTIMAGSLRATFGTLPRPDEMLAAVPEILEPRQGKRLIGLSALALNPSEARGSGLPFPDLSVTIRALAMELKRAIGMKGTRVVFPPSRRSDLSTAQLLHNALPQAGTAVFFLVASQQTDLVVIEAIQDIEAYTRRDRGRPHADPGSGMAPPKLAQMLLNLSLVPAGGTVYDPFCGVGTIPMEAMGMGLSVAASDASAKQVQRTKENLAWFGRVFPAAVGPASVPTIFVHEITARTIPLAPNSVDVVVSEGWLGPVRNVPRVPQEAERVFTMVTELLDNLFSHTRTVVRKGGRLLIAVPAFRAQKRLLRFPLDRLRAKAWTPERLVSEEWRAHQTFREAARGTLLYGRPDAHVLREIVRFRKVS